MSAFWVSGAAITFQDMVMRASKGVLNYAVDDMKGKNVTGRVEQDHSDLTSNDSGVHLDVASCPVEHNSPVEAASSFFW